MNDIKNVFSKQLWYKRPKLLILIGALLVFIILIIFVINLLLKNPEILPQQSAPINKIMTDEERADVIKQLSASTTSATPTVSDKNKADIVKQLSAPSAVTAPKVSDEERAKIINSLSN